MLRRWTMFVLWAAAGAALTLIVSAVGVFTVPAGIALVVVLTVLAPREVIGFVAGVGATAAVIGTLNLGYTPCSSVEVLGPGQTDFECGGFDGTPWLVAGLALLAAAVLLFAALSRGRSVHDRH
jgi:hypothetical protein